MSKEDTQWVSNTDTPQGGEREWGDKEREGGGNETKTY